MDNDCHLLQQVRVLDPASKTDSVADVLICGNEIEAIETRIVNVSPQTKVFNCRGLLIGSGLVDLFSHSGEPGHEERETFSSLAAAAAAGGFTRVNVLPDTLPTIDNLAVISLLQQSQHNSFSSICSPTKMSYWGALTAGLEGQQMTELADLAPAVIGFADGESIEDLGLLKRLLEYLKPLNKPIALVSVNLQLKGNGVIREGVESFRYGMPGDPFVSESVALAAVLELVSAIETPVHLMKISTRRGVEIIADAKERGLPITASTTWMHLLWDTEAVSSYDPNLHLEPPLGNQIDREVLIEGVKQGVIDAIAVDHTPYLYEEKTVSFAKSPPGVIGLELVLPLLWQRFVASGEWSAIELWQALSAGPLKCLRQEPIRFSPRQKAELVLFDPQATWIVNQQTLKSRSTNTPWLEKQLTGRVIKIWNA